MQRQASMSYVKRNECGGLWCSCIVLQLLQGNMTHLSIKLKIKLRKSHSAFCFVMLHMNSGSHVI